MIFDPTPELAATPEPRDSLSDVERQVLDFETAWLNRRYAGAKETAIRETFGISAIRYYQILNQLLDDERALTSHPTLVNLRRRQREARHRERAARTH